MFRSTRAAAAALVLAGLGAAEAAAVEQPARCVPARPHRHVATRHRAPPAAYAARPIYRPPPVYNYEDNGRYDDADLPLAVPAGQPASWLDGYGTRPAYTPGYGVSDTYGGSAQVWPRAIPPAGGLGVYIPGAYGPGPRIIHIPAGS